MSNYFKATNFAAKDTLLSGDPNKIVKGTEINDEFDAIQTAVNSKANKNDAALTGIPTAPTAVIATNTTQIATTAFVENAINAIPAPALNGSIASQDADNVSITGGSITDITDLAIADGGTGASTAADARTNLDVPTTTGTGASGTWDINISGQAATVSSISASVVNAAIASSSVGAVGTYALLVYSTTGTATGATRAGSILRYTDVNSSTGGAAPAGTWRCMGYSKTIPSGNEGSFFAVATLWLRIS